MESKVLLLYYIVIRSISITTELGFLYSDRDHGGERLVGL